MDDLQLSDEERELELALRSEAETEQLEFSNSLHSQIMGAVRRESVGGLAAAAASLALTSVAVPASESGDGASSVTRSIYGFMLVAAASVAVLVMGGAWLIDLGSSPAIVESPEQHEVDAVDHFVADGADGGVLDSVLLAAEELLLAVPMDEVEGDDQQRQATDDKLVSNDASTSEHWGNLAHDFEILADVLFESIDEGEIETP